MVQLQPWAVRSAATPDISPSSVGTLSNSTLRRRWLWISRALPQSRTARLRCRLSGDTSWRRRLRRRRQRRRRKRRRNITGKEPIAPTVTDQGPGLGRERENIGGGRAPTLTPARREKGGIRRGGKRKRKTRRGGKEVDLEAEAEVDKEDETVNKLLIFVLYYLGI